MRDLELQGYRVGESAGPVQPTAPTAPAARPLYELSPGELSASLTAAAWPSASQLAVQHGARPLSAFTEPEAA